MNFGKDSPIVRANMQARNIMPHLHLQAIDQNQEKLYMHNATYVLLAKDKVIACFEDIENTNSLYRCLAHEN